MVQHVLATSCRRACFAETAPPRIHLTALYTFTVIWRFPTFWSRIEIKVIKRWFPLDPGGRGQYHDRQILRSWDPGVRSETGFQDISRRKDKKQKVAVLTESKPRNDEVLPLMYAGEAKSALCASQLVLVSGGTCAARAATLAPTARGTPTNTAAP